MSVFLKNKIDNLPSNKDTTGDGNVKNSAPLSLYQIKRPVFFDLWIFIELHLRRKWKCWWGNNSSMPSAVLFGANFMEEFLLSYFSNEERTETFNVALSLFCLLVTQFYKGKLYMDDAMHKNLFTILYQNDHLMFFYHSMLFIWSNPNSHNNHQSKSVPE